MNEERGEADKALAGSTKAEDVSQQYFAPAHPLQSRRAPTGGQSVGEDSGTFLSEPSVSEGGDSRIRAPHRLNPSVPFRRTQQERDDARNGMESPHPLLPPGAQPSPVPSSPGNTSLSSWESPAIKQKVFLHYTPEKKSQVRLDRTSNTVRVVPNTSRRDGESRQLPYLDTLGHSNHRPANQPPPTMNTSDHLRPVGSSSGHSKSSSEGRLHSLGHFLHGLRFRSGGQAHEGHGHAQLPQNPRTAERLQANGDVDDGMRTGSAAVASGDNGTEDERSGAIEHVQTEGTKEATTGARVAGLRSPPSSIFDSHRTTDMSLAMTLSASEDEGDRDTTMDYGVTDESILDWEGEDSADDEKTAERPPRMRAFATGKTPPSHRRSRSGDAVAATIATGGTDWKGMEQDRLPIPGHDFCDDDDDETENRANPRSNPPTPSRFRGRGAHNNTERPYLARRSSDGSVPRRSSSEQSDWRKGPPVTQSSSRESQTSGEARVSVSSSGPRCPSGETEGSEVDSDGVERRASVHQNRLQCPLDNGDLRTMERQFEDREFRGSYQSVMRPRASHRDSPFANIGKKSTEKANRKTFLPQASVIADDPTKAYATYVCPRCRTIQREFFTVADAPRQLESASGYLALYFTIYVIASLFIFGLEEGWHPLDCIYFAVVTLTTAGLGDFVPTTNANKIICSIFIYFGVACIGLLLGSYIAGMLDDKAYRDAKAKQINSCPNCARLQILRDAAEKESRSIYSPVVPLKNRRKMMNRHMSERIHDKQTPAVDHSAIYSAGHHHKHRQHMSRSPSRSTDHSDQVELISPQTADSKHPLIGSVGSRDSHSFKQSPPFPTQQVSPNVLGSPMTRQILGRQSHTRHDSIDITGQDFFGSGVSSSGAKTYGATRSRGFSADYGATPAPPTIGEHDTFTHASIPAMPIGQQRGYSGNYVAGTDDYSDFDDEDDDDDSSYSSSSSSSVEVFLDEKTNKIRMAKYVFLTLRQALVNSLVIIAVGCIGFWLIEGFSLVDSWYFTTVFLTTVGYGDITPASKGGKLFATVYILVAGTILLNNMSMISMIPLELRRRRIERAVLTQFGDQLDDAALRELATGPLIQRLHLSASRTDGLDECTREMFSLAMLVRLGKVTEQDIRESFAAFQRLDVNDEGVLNSKSIIAGMIQKRRSTHGQRSLHGTASSQHPPPPPPIPEERPRVPAPIPESSSVWAGNDDSAAYNVPRYQDPEAGANERSSLLHHQTATPPDSFRRVSRSSEPHQSPF